MHHVVLGLSSEMSTPAFCVFLLNLAKGSQRFSSWNWRSSFLKPLDIERKDILPGYKHNAISHMTRLSLSQQIQQALRIAFHGNTDTVHRKYVRSQKLSLFPKYPKPAMKTTFAVNFKQRFQAAIHLKSMKISNKYHTKQAKECEKSVLWPNTQQKSVLAV